MSKELAALVTISPAPAAQRPNAPASFRVGAGDCAHGSCRPFRAAARHFHRALNASPQKNAAERPKGGRQAAPRSGAPVLLRSVAISRVPALGTRISPGRVAQNKHAKQQLDLAKKHASLDLHVRRRHPSFARPSRPSVGRRRR